MGSAMMKQRAERKKRAKKQRTLGGPDVQVKHLSSKHKSHPLLVKEDPTKIERPHALTLRESNESSLGKIIKKKSNSEENLENMDISRDARTPSPIFDEMKNVALMSCTKNSQLEKVEGEECPSLNEFENKEAMSVPDEINARLRTYDLRDGEIISNVEIKPSCDNRINPNIASKAHLQMHSNSPPSFKCTELPPLKGQCNNKLPPIPSNGSMNSPTVNYPVVENLLASGDDYVDVLDEKDVVKASDSLTDTIESPEKLKDQQCSEQSSGWQRSPNGSSSDPPLAANQLAEQERSTSNSDDPSSLGQCSGERNNSQTAFYNDWQYPHGLSLEKIECIRSQVYQEGLAPLKSDGGVSFFVPVEESGMQPLSTDASVPPRLNVSRKSGLTYEERRILADVNRSKQLDKRKEFAKRNNQSVVRFCNGVDKCEGHTHF